MLVSWLVSPFIQTKMSATVGWTARKLGANIYDPKRMDPNDFGDECCSARFLSYFLENYLDNQND